MKPITSKDFRRTTKGQPYYAGRWEYFQLAIQLAGRPASVLELGPHTLPLFPAGDTMDVSGALSPTYRHDATQVPWPVDRHYDLFIGLQVWEHLRESQAAAFAEVMRVASRAVLSFPNQWDCPADLSHHGIDEQRIAEWTCHVPLLARLATARQDRVVYYWEF